MNYDGLVVDFQKHFGKDPSQTYFSPGRVNLIGEYTDFNGGYVLPTAIDRGTYFAVRANSKACITVYSDAFDDPVKVPLNAIAKQAAEGGWGDYIKGSLVEFDRRSLTGEQGLDIFITGDLPRSSGLSSSASLTVGLVFLLNDMWSCNLDRLSLVKFAKNVENEFIGLQCGIMDQFAVAMGKTEHAIYLHCHTLDSELIPVNMDGYELVITDSRVPRKLSESSYNLRRTECSTALEALRQDSDIEFLCAASLADLENNSVLKTGSVIYRRARHVISENTRVQESVHLLKKGDLAGFGELMYASHDSLRDDFEVSCKELNILVEAAKGIEGVVGSRMTGAGFGGCTVSIVATSAVPNFISELTAAYSAATPFEAIILRCGTGDGVKRLSIDDLPCSQS